MAGLSNKQKRILAQNARAAWAALAPVDQERFTVKLINRESDPLISDSRVFEEWRREEQEKATGCRSLRLMNQHDYLPCLLHFQMLADNKGQEHLPDRAPSKATVRTLGRLGGDEMRRARWRLSEALRERDLPVQYAEAICRTQFRCDLKDASLKQVWNLFYTVRNRRKPAQTA